METTFETITDEKLEAGLIKCERDGCQNPPVDHNEWEGEFCSSVCAVLHCKAIFKKWAKERQEEAANAENHKSN